MKIVGIQEAKTTLSRLIDRAIMGEDIVISPDKNCAVRLVPIRTRSGCRKLGILKGKLVVGRAFFDSLPPEELASWEYRSS
jgi:antitoxin (DNA-binding transcriptional repressor) of toxin-antitoxin stability system